MSPKGCKENPRLRYVSFLDRRKVALKTWGFTIDLQGISPQNMACYGTVAPFFFGSGYSLWISMISPHALRNGSALAVDIIAGFFYNLASTNYGAYQLYYRLWINSNYGYQLYYKTMDSCGYQLYITNVYKLWITNQPYYKTMVTFLCLLWLPSCTTWML